MRHSGIINKCYHQEKTGEFVWSKYGGRVNPDTGEPEPIQVYEPWHDKYVFAEDIERLIGFPPDKGWILTRIDTSKDFAPDNVQWVKNFASRISNSRFMKVSVTIEPSTKEETDYEQTPTSVQDRLLEMIEMTSTVSKLLSSIETKPERE